ncbi:MAG: hypothetical protein JWM74_3495 [Myxococcaceae bacterium]|nr:hypothetical protein [Myxococcaceae bacterium]
MKARGLLVTGVLGLATIGACRPALDDTVSAVDTPRLLAVRAVPAEAQPGEVVRLEPIYADPTGVVTDARAEVAFCTARKPLSEPGSVSSACLGGGDPAVLSIVGVGTTAEGALPKEACRLFGPDRPVGLPGEPAGRPSDPDGTGGYYVPGRVRREGSDPAIFEVRVRCGLSGATQAVVADFGRRYRTNTNPQPELEVVRGTAVVKVAEGEELTVAPHEIVRLHLWWASCGDDDAVCTGAERYVAYDTASRTIVPRREAIRASWFGTGGSFEHDRTSRNEDDTETSSDNVFTAPASGATTLWIVLRDARAGVGLRTVRLVVR